MSDWPSDFFMGYQKPLLIDTSISLNSTLNFALNFMLNFALNHQQIPKAQRVYALSTLKSFSRRKKTIKLSTLNLAPLYCTYK